MEYEENPMIENAGYYSKCKIKYIEHDEKEKPEFEDKELPF